VSAICPNPECRALLVEGALRCRSCGSDARAADRTPGVGSTVSLASVVAGPFRAMELLDEIALLAPATLEEFRRLDRPRKERLVAILSELIEVTRKR
jgi:hypothetical protein